MSREQFERLEDRQLSWTCAEPLVRELQRERVQALQESSSASVAQGAQMEVRSDFYAELTSGQQALLMFWVVENHWCKGMPDFYWWSAYFLVQEKLWAALKRGLRLFGDSAMIALLEEVEQALEASNRLAAWPDVSAGDLETDAVLCAAMTRLCQSYQTLARSTQQVIATYIRNHPSEFVELIQ